MYCLTDLNNCRDGDPSYVLDYATLATASLDWKTIVMKFILSEWLLGAYEAKCFPVESDRGMLSSRVGTYPISCLHGPLIAQQSRYKTR